MDVGEVTKAPDSPAETRARHRTETYTSDALEKKHEVAGHVTPPPQTLTS